METITAHCPTSDHFYTGNGQPIREAILRAATTHCLAYATDVIYLLTSDRLRALTSTHNDCLDIYYYRDYGVEWRTVPDNAIYHLRLTKDGNNYILTEE